MRDQSGLRDDRITQTALAYVFARILIENRATLFGMRFNSSRSSASAGWNAQSASLGANLRIAGCRYVCAIPGPPLKLRPFLKKVRRPGRCCPARACLRQADRDLVSGLRHKSRHRTEAHGGRAWRPTRHIDQNVGEARHAAACATRPTAGLGLYPRRGVPAAQHNFGAGAARSQRPVAIVPSGRQQSPDRSGRACGSAALRRGLAQRQ